jgi:hypothetical protein
VVAIERIVIKYIRDVPTASVVVTARILGGTGHSRNAANTAEHTPSAIGNHSKTSD